METVFGKFQMKRTDLGIMPPLDEGEPFFALDTFDMYVGSSAGPKRLRCAFETNAMLVALAALTPAADKIAYFNSSSTGALTECTAIGRGILGEPTYHQLVDDIGEAAAIGTGGLLRGTSPRITTDLAPATTGAATLGTAGLPWGNEFIKSGGIINFGNGNVTITHSTSLLTLLGNLTVTQEIIANEVSAQTVDVGTLISPIVNGAADLGSPSHSFGRLCLYPNATIDINNGNWLATHSSGILTVGTGEIRITNPGTNDNSVAVLKGTAPMTHPFYDQGGEVYHVKAYGAVGNGSTDDTAAIQAALDACKAAGGGTVVLPNSNCKITAALTYNVSALSNDTNRLCIRGQGPMSVLTLASVAAAAIDYTANTAYPQGHLVLRDFRIQGNKTTNSIGVKLRGGLAFNSWENVQIYGMDFGIDLADVDQSTFYNVSLRNGIHGGIIRAAISVTEPNNYHFLGCTISNNDVYGLQINHANGFTFLGGSVQYNGTVGGGTGQYGIKLIEAGAGYGNINFIGVTFEGNGGDADLISDQNTYFCVVNINGCTFTRTATFGAGVGYATYNLHTTGSSGGVIYNLSGNTHRSDLASYTPNAGRPYLKFDNPYSLITDGGTNFYSSAVEGPPWRHSHTFPRAIVLLVRSNPSQLTADVTDYDLGNEITRIVLTSNAARKINGIKARTGGSLIFLSNLGAYPITLVHSAPVGAAANQFNIGQDRVLWPGDGVILSYDDGNSSWNVFNHGGKTIAQVEAAWTAWTPTITPATGSYTTVTGAGGYRQTGQTVEWDLTITYTTIGTGGGKTKFPTPVGTAKRASVAVGIEVNQTGFAATAYVDTGAAGTYFAQFYDNTNIAANGRKLYLSGQYEIA